MPPESRFRLGELTLADLDALAVSAASRSQAVREAVAYWRRLVQDAAELNAAELNAHDWERLAHLNQPDAMPEQVRGEEERTQVRDWSAYLAAELCGMWEGRACILPYHKEEKKACLALAKRVGGWGVVRGYALFAALRWFWSDAGKNASGEWWRPGVWMTPAG